MTRTKSLATSLLSLSAAAVLALSAAGCSHRCPGSRRGQVSPFRHRHRRRVRRRSRLLDRRPDADRRPRRCPGRANLERSATLHWPGPCAGGKGDRPPWNPLPPRPRSCRPASESPVAHIGKIFFTHGRRKLRLLRQLRGRPPTRAPCPPPATASTRAPARMPPTSSLFPPTRTAPHPTASGPPRPSTPPRSGPPRQHPVRHRLRRGVPAQRPDPRPTGGRLRGAVQRGPRPDLQVLRLPCRFPVQRRDPQELHRNRHERHRQPGGSPPRASPAT